LVESVQHLASFCRPRVLDVTTYERVGWKDPCHSHPFVPGVGPKRVNLEVCALERPVYRQIEYDRTGGGREWYGALAEFEPLAEY
jgi:hypothetical protein